MNKLFFIIGLLLLAIEVFADPVTYQQARQRAEGFLQGKQLSSSRVNRRIAVNTQDGEVEPLYIFNTEGQHGFVIVSGCDDIEPILAYSDTGSFDVTDMPENVREWIEGYRSQIEYRLKRQSTKTTIRASRTEWQTIDPLLKTKWNQRDPYNRLCPDYKGVKCVTGCVATAIAQVLNYLHCPSVATPSVPAYQTSKLGINVPEYPSTTFNWEKMHPTYVGDYTEEQADAVAKLMRYCGQVVSMDYSPDGSSAPPALKRWYAYFGISRDATSLSRGDFSTSIWEEILYNELSEKRCVFYMGSSSSGTHAFVCDGYDGDGRFHFNWGWGGKYDGFFVTNADDILFPSIQSIIINLKPDDGSAPVVKLTNTIPEQALGTYNRISNEADFTDVVLKGSIEVFDNVETSQEVEYGWGLYSTDFEKPVWTVEGTVKNQSSKFSTDANVSFGAGLNKGTYYLRQIYRKKGNVAWRYCYKAYKQYYQVDIEGNTMTVKRIDTEASSDFRVNSVTVDGEWRRWRQVMLDISLTNTSPASFVNVYVGIDGESHASESGCYVDQGCTTKLRIPLKLFVSGGHKKISICKDPALSDIAYSFDVDIIDTPEQKLSGSMKIDNMLVRGYTPYAGVDGKVEVTLNVRNERQSTFDDNIYFSVTSFMNRYETEDIGSMPVVLAPGEEKELHYTITGLNKGTEYTLEACYYSESDLITFDSQLFHCLNPQIKVDSVYYNTIKANRYVFLEADVENVGDVTCDLLFYSINGSTPSSFVETLKPGEKKSQSIPFYAEAAGSYELEISTDWNGEYIIYRETIMVGESQPQELTCTYGLDDAVSISSVFNYSASTAPKVMLHLRNDGVNIYDDDIMLKLNFKSEKSEYSEYEAVVHALIQPGDSIDLTKSFPEMGEGECTLTVYYYSGNDLMWVGSTTYILGKVADAVAENVDFKDTMEVNSSGEIKVTFKNTGDIDISRLFLKFGGTVHSMSTDAVQPGASGTATFQFTVEEPAGETPFFIYIDESMRKAIFEGRVTIRLGKTMDAVAENVDFKDTMERNSYEKITVTFKNTGDLDISFLSLKFGESVYPRMIDVVHPGASGTFTFRFTVEEPAGETPFFIYIDESMQKVIFEGRVTVKKEHVNGDVEIQVTADGRRHGAIGDIWQGILVSDTVATITCILTNEQEETYEDAVIIRLYKGRGCDTLVDEYSEEVVVPAGESRTVTKSFGNLIPGYWYKVIVSKIYYSRERIAANLLILPALGKAFTVDDVSVVKQDENSEKGILRAHIYNGSEVDFQQLKLLHDVDSPYDFTNYEANLASGQSIDVELPIKLSRGKVQTYVLSTYRNECVLYTDSFEADKLTDVRTIYKSQQSTDVYELGGRKVSNKVQPLDQLPSGVYIINGKKQVVKR